jgi:hypothetical protein
MQHHTGGHVALAALRNAWLRQCQKPWDFADASFSSRYRACPGPIHERSAQHLSTWLGLVDNVRNVRLELLASVQSTLHPRNLQLCSTSAAGSHLPNLYPQLQQYGGTAEEAAAGPADSPTRWRRQSCATAQEPRKDVSTCAAVHYCLCLRPMCPVNVNLPSAAWLVLAALAYVVHHGLIQQSKPTILVSPCFDHHPIGTPVTEAVLEL